MNHIKSEKYNIPKFNERMMGPNPIKLLEELLKDNQIQSSNANNKPVVCDLGCGKGITSVFLNKEY